jgi:pimeloyl-ACP methyl ester carboxylesterase
MTNATDCQAGVDERVLAWRGVRLRYYAGGAGAPLLLLDGSAASFGQLVPLVGAGRRLLLPDVPGRGSEASSPTGIADLLAALCAHEDAGEVDVFGSGAGATIGLLLALRRPGLVRRLVLAGRADGARPACPVLVLSGGRDGFQLARRLGALLRVVAGSGGALLEERPDVCAAVVRDFLV